jgi:hypothetical protein
MSWKWVPKELGEVSRRAGTAAGNGRGGCLLRSTGHTLEGLSLINKRQGYVGGGRGGNVRATNTPIHADRRYCFFSGNAGLPMQVFGEDRIDKTFGWF